MILSCPLGNRSELKPLQLPKDRCFPLNHRSELEPLQLFKVSLNRGVVSDITHINIGMNNHSNC